MAKVKHDIIYMFSVWLSKTATYTYLISW